MKTTFSDQSSLIKKTREQGAFITSYAPIARGQVEEEPVLQHIAKKHKVSAAQVALRWLVQQEDVVAIPKSAQLVRIKKNFDVFNFSLTEAEMRKIAPLKERNLRLIDPDFAPSWSE
ncbi:MAG: aldo/keto reductase [Owenweeksia sp.]|nr:aldo/keto reductase [Owenweeksia sp.]